MLLPLAQILDTSRPGLTLRGKLFTAVSTLNNLFSSKTSRGRPSSLSCFLTDAKVAKWSDEIKEGITTV